MAKLFNLSSGAAAEGNLADKILNTVKTSKQQTSQIADMLWISDKTFSPKCESFLNYFPMADTSQ